MKKFTCVLGFAALAVLAAVVMTAGQASAQSVCYSWNIFPLSPLRLETLFDSRISTNQEESAFHHPDQAAITVHGKGVSPCLLGAPEMAAATGTIVLAKPGAFGVTSPNGAHMGLRVHSVRGFPTTCREYTLDCTTNEKTPEPNTWTCFSRNEFDIDHGPSILTKVDPLTNPLCSTFEDGSFNVDQAAAAAAAGSGPGPGSPRP